MLGLTTEFLGLLHEPCQAGRYPIVFSQASSTWWLLSAAALTRTAWAISKSVMLIKKSLTPVHSDTSNVLAQALWRGSQQYAHESRPKFPLRIHSRRSPTMMYLTRHDQCFRQQHEQSQNTCVSRRGSLHCSDLLFAAESIVCRTSNMEATAAEREKCRSKCDHWCALQCLFPLNMPATD